MMHVNRNRGSITVEAAIVMPVFICVVISMAMLIKLVYVYDVVQHSIDEAANELAVYSYLYRISDLQRLDKSIQEGLDENAEYAERHYGAIVDAFDVLKNAHAVVKGRNGDVDAPASSNTGYLDKTEQLIVESKDIISRGMQLSQQGIESMNRLYEALEEACSDPGREAESIAWMLSKSLYDDAKGITAVPIIKHTVKKYLYENEEETVDERLKRLNIARGFEGLDFHSSTLFAGDEIVSLVVAYEVRLPLPIKILPDIYIVQRSAARAWLEGGDGSFLKELSIWDLPNKERGMKIEELYKGNLPFDFPVIDIYDASDQSGTSIKSINLNSKTYQDAGSLKRKLKQYVDDIKNCNEIRYKKENYVIKSKKLIIVIPEGSINEQNDAVLKEIKGYAEAAGIDITISELR